MTPPEKIRRYFNAYPFDPKSTCDNRTKVKTVSEIAPLLRKRYFIQKTGKFCMCYYRKRDSQYTLE